jgi:hypothetical protein
MLVIQKLWHLQFSSSASKNYTQTPKDNVNHWIASLEPYIQSLRFTPNVLQRPPHRHLSNRMNDLPLDGEPQESRSMAGQL